ncbi:MAG TPA: hypothetical protein VF575_01545 [Candidatus Saccharimonadales bacterium]|jgi:acetolactate synthase small subunit
MPANTTCTLVITAKDTMTVLPRCLQILSRRGCKLTALTTGTLPNAEVVMRCTILAPGRWQEPLIKLLERIVDVRHVELETAPETLS